MRRLLFTIAIAVMLAGCTDERAKALEAENAELRSNVSTWRTYCGLAVAGAIAALFIGSGIGSSGRRE